MNSTSTLTSVTTDNYAPVPSQVISEQTAFLVLKILIYGVTPGICVFGIFGNILSIIILKKHGLHKSSNILLVSMAFSDICFLITFNNVPKALYDIQGGGRFLYSHTVSHFLFIIYFILTIVDYAMAFISLTIPALITAERLVAVFLPLSMKAIVTPFRTWTIVIVLTVYSFVVSIYTCFWYRLDYSFDPEHNRTVGQMVQTDLFDDHSDFRLFMDLIHLSFKIQPLFTLVGCILIIIKVKLASIKRQKMSGTSVKSTVSKTTRMLMAVCVVYICVCVIIAMPTFLPPDVVHYSLSSESDSYLGMIMYQVLNIVVCLNSSWNFIIYIVFNKQFRDSFNAIAVKYYCYSGNKQNRP